MFNMSTHSLRDLRLGLGNTIREVAYTGEEAIVTDSGTEIAAIISMEDYERLHEHADVADAFYLRDARASGFASLSMAEMLQMLGVDDAPRGMAA
jgi:antitoxin YefM